MKIEIEIGEGNVGQSVQEILQSLAPEERRAMAKEVLQKWLADDVHKHERAVKETEVVERIKKENQSSDWERNKTESEIRNSYKFREYMGGWESTREKFVRAITGEVTSVYKETVKTIVENDPALQKMRQEIGKIVVELFPKMVHDAVTAWFGMHINRAIEASIQASVQIPEIQKLQTQIAGRLTQIH